MAELNFDKPQGCRAVAWYAVADVQRVRIDDETTRMRAIATGGIACQCEAITCIAPIQEVGTEETYRGAHNSAVGKLAVDAGRIVASLCETTPPDAL